MPLDMPPNNCRHSCAPRTLACRAIKSEPPLPQFPIPEPAATAISFSCLFILLVLEDSHTGPHRPSLPRRQAPSTCPSSNSWPRLHRAEPETEHHHPPLRVHEPPRAAATLISSSTQLRRALLLLRNARVPQPSGAATPWPRGPPLLRHTGALVVFAWRYGSTSPCRVASPRRRGRATPPRSLAEPSSNRGALLLDTIEHATSPTTSRRIRAIPATTTCPCFHLVASPTRRALLRRDQAEDPMTSALPRPRCALPSSSSSSRTPASTATPRLHPRGPSVSCQHPNLHFFGLGIGHP
jgi:hypothetical protein